MRHLIQATGNHRLSCPAILLVAMLAALMLAVPALGQVEQEDTAIDADVDAIAANLYYDVDTPLIGCETTACVQIRDQIRTLLAEGRNEEDVIYELVHLHSYRILGISDNAVNDIAEQLYCPVCENIPLDTCPTEACRDWRNEIGIFIAQGMTEDAIIDDFVRRFGDRVVGTPQDPVLWMLSLVTPWLLIGLMLAAAVYTYRRWQKQRMRSAESPPLDLTPGLSANDAEYLAQLEQDLSERQ